MATPAFVQRAPPSYQATGLAPTATFSAAPTSGNLLLAYLYTGQTQTTPTGWTLLNTYYYGYRYGYLFSKTSNGTETGFTGALGASGPASVCLDEWVGVAGTIKNGGLAAAASMTFGPTDAPIGASSIPALFIGMNYGQGVATPSSPWTGQQTNTTQANSTAAEYYEAAPNAAASLTLTVSATTAASVQWTNVWIDPSASSTPDNLGAGASSGAGTALATLALGVVLAGASLGIGTGSAQLAQFQTLGGSASGATVATGALSTGAAPGVAFSGQSYGVGAAVTSLAQSQGLSGSAQGSSLAIASASQSLGFTGVAQGGGTAQSTLTPGLPLAGGAQGSGSAQGSLAQFLGLAGSSTGAGSASASIAQQQALAGATDGVGIGSGTLTIPSASGLALTGQSYGAGFATATVAQHVPFAGSAVGASFGSAQVAQSASLAGSATGFSASLASIVQSASFVGSAVGSGSASAPLGFGVSLSGSAVGSGSSVGTLQSTIPTGYVANPNYYGIAPARVFYAPQPARGFYSAATPRSFYVQSKEAMANQFPNAMDPAETKVLTLDATADLPAGVTLTSIVGTPIVIVVGGTDPNAANVFSGALINASAIAANPPGIPVQIAAGKAVQIIATNPANGAWYEVRIPCQTSQANNITTLKAILTSSAG